jgi:hypothetical protein
VAKVGSRVGVILDVEGNKVRLFGYGVYAGDEIPHEKVGGLGYLVRENPSLTNPKIILDSGKDVFGCECWWGPEELVKGMVEGKDIKIIDIDEYRSGSV